MRIDINFLENPFGAHYIKMCATDRNGIVTLQGFLSLWTLLTTRDYKKTLKYLAYLGDDGARSQAFEVHDRVREMERRSITRNVFTVFVFGSKGCGKSEFINGVLGSHFHSEQSRSNNSNNTNTNNNNKFYVSLGKLKNQGHHNLVVANSVIAQGLERYLIV
jgi:hypothetical protein